MDQTSQTGRWRWQFSLRTILWLTLVCAAAGAGYAWRNRPVNRPLALEGYCPVTLQQVEVWKKGDPHLQSECDGRRYWFVGSKEKQLFDASPRQYAPVCSGDDIVELKDHGRHILGQRRHGLFYQNSVFLFSSESNLQKFLANPQHYYGIPQRTPMPVTP